jgi:hypothetical protein
VYPIQKNKEALLDADKEVGLEVNSEKTKYMFMPHYQKSGQRHCIQKANSLFENVVNFKYLGKTTDQNYMHKDIKSRLNSVYAC